MKRIDRGDKEDITLDLEGEAIPAKKGEPVAASLLAAGQAVFARSVKYHRPRGPFCMSGACSHCLMRVDGVPNLHTCRVPARPGMRLERQNAYPSAELDLFAATDWLFPHGLDHHQMFAGVPVAEKVLTRVARHLAGLGTLPERPAPEREPAEILRSRVAVVGAGAAGLFAALALAEKKLPFVLVEREDHLGGRLAHAPLLGNEPPIPESARLPGLRLGSTAIGLFDDEQGRFLGLVEGARLLKLYADRFLFAPGGHPRNMVFENNDTPGVLAGRAISRLVRRHGVLPGERFALVGRGPELYALARLLTSCGASLSAIVDDSPSPGPEALAGVPWKAHGRRRLRQLEVRLAGEKRQRISCDTVGVCQPPSPAFELARQGGALVAFDQAAGAFAVKADREGRTTQPGLFAAGEVTGPMEAGQAAEDGRRAGEAIARELAGGKR